MHLSALFFSYMTDYDAWWSWANVKLLQGPIFKLDLRWMEASTPTLGSRKSFSSVNIISLPIWY